MLTMLSLLDLETEVIALILEFVHDSSPSTTKAIACVSKYFNELTKSIGHRHKHVNLDGYFDSRAGTVALIESWNKDQSILSNIRSLNISGRLLRRSEADHHRRIGRSNEDTEDDEDSEDDHDDDFDDSEEEGQHDFDETLNVDEHSWTPLVTLLSRIGRLYQFTWNVSSPLPVPVLDALETYQKLSTLRIFNFVRLSVKATEPDLIETRLAKSSALTHIRHVWQNTGLWPDLQEAAFRSIVASAPNLEYAGFMSNQPPPSLTDYEKNQFEEWKLSFNTHTKPNTSVRQLTLDGVQISKKTLDDWSTIVDLESLHNVKFSRGVPTLSYFQYAATALPNLKHLSLNLRSLQERRDSLENLELANSVKEYIKDCSPLQNLSLWSWMGVVPLTDILERHGSTLETLQLHERDKYQRRQILSVEDIESIRHSCPRLRDFTFDLERHHADLVWDSDPNKTYYEQLAKFGRLSRLQIYFDAGPRWSTISSLDGPLPDTDTTQAQPQPQSPLQPQSPPASPPHKKRRIDLPVRCSKGTNIKHYVLNVWHHVFDSRGGPRRLDIKVGEWESQFRYYNTSLYLARWFSAHPSDRDDILEPAVSALQKYAGDVVGSIDGRLDWDFGG